MSPSSLGGGKQTTTAGEHAELYAHLEQAVDDVKSGRVQDVDEAFDDILSELDRVKI